MSKMFYYCSNLENLDISQFSSFNSNEDLFKNLPSNGTIKVNQNFFEKIKEQIPNEWDITII